nr:immunoglobulin heavy chain junction region [Mus musculus]
CARPFDGYYYWYFDVW